MLKILHTADVHLGARFAGMGDRGDAQREQLRTTFKKVAATALEERVGIMLISGDLFDSNQQPQRNIDLVIEQFGVLNDNGIPICIVPGTHDSLDSSSIYRKVDFERRCPNLTVFAGEEMSFVEYPNLDITVYGRPNLSNRAYSSPLKGIKRTTSSKFHVAMAHGSFYIPERTAEDDHVFRLEEIRDSGMDYLALGHWHRAWSCCDKPAAWYSGPPEWIPDQRERGVVLLVNLLDSGVVKVEPRETGVRGYDEVEIDMSEIQSRAMLEAMISAGASSGLVKRVTLRGLRDAELMVNTEELEAQLGNHFFHLRVADRSHPGVLHVPDDAERLILNRFIRLMNEQIENSEGEEREIAERALQYGVALLDGRDVV